MENVNEKVNEPVNGNVNIKSFKYYICKHSSTIAIVLSIISILFSSFALINVNKRPRRDFHASRPYDIEENAPDGYFNGGNYSGPHNNQFYGQRPEKRSQMKNNNKFNNGRQGNKQDGERNFNNDARFNKPNDNQFGNKPKDNNDSANSTKNDGPKVAPEVSPDK